MFRIVPVKGTPWIVNADHVLSLVRTNDGWNKANSVFDVSVRDWLAWSRTHKHIHKLFRVRVAFTAGPEPLIDPYFLGVLLGDGSIHHNVCVTKPDAEIAEEVHRQAAALAMRVRTQSTPGKCLVHHLVRAVNDGRENEIACRLRALNLYGTHSETKFVPLSYKTDSRERRLELLAGLIDTDGSLSGKCYDFISKSKQLSDDVAFIARSLGYAAYVAACHKFAQTGNEGTYHRVSISGDLSGIPCRIPRKRAPQRLQKKNVLRTGFYVEPVGQG